MTQPSQVDVGAGTAAALLAAETTFTAAMLAAYASWLAEVSALIFAVLPINPSLIWSLQPSWERHVDSLIRQLGNVARMGWENAAGQLGFDAPFDITNPVLQDQLARTRNFMVQTPDEVYRMILLALDENAGNPAAQEAAVHNILSITGTANWTSRAKTVSVTEVNRTFHMGSLALAMQAPGAVVKKWIAKEDKATRPAHAAADNQLRPVMQPFIVGGEPLMAPGDPAGSAWNLISCRCALNYARRA